MRLTVYDYGQAKSDRAHGIPTIIYSNNMPIICLYHSIPCGV